MILFHLRIAPLKDYLGSFNISLLLLMMVFLFFQREFYKSKYRDIFAVFYFYFIANFLYNYCSYSNCYELFESINSECLNSLGKTGNNDQISFKDIFSESCNVPLKKLNTKNYFCFFLITLIINMISKCENMTSNVVYVLKLFLFLIIPEFEDRNRYFFTRMFLNIFSTKFIKILITCFFAISFQYMKNRTNKRLWALFDSFKFFFK